MDLRPSFVHGEIYRIQNVDHATFLEILETTAGSPLVLRPYKEYSEKQQWTLEDFPPHRGLTLRNVGASRMLNGCLLHINDMGVVTLDPTQGTTVLVESLKNEHLLKFLCRNEIGYRSGLLAASGPTSITFKDSGTIGLPRAKDNLKWRLMPVWPSIPSGPTYTIRTTYGLSLTLDESDKPNAANLTESGELPKPLPPQWEVEALLNGKIHLRNLSNKLYFRALKGSPSLGNLTGSEKGEPWQLTSTSVRGGYTLSTSGDIALAVTATREGRKTRITLSPSSDVMNQIWLFEWVDNPTDEVLKLEVSA